MSGPILLEINGVEMIGDQGAEWSMNFEEVLGAGARASMIIQDRDNSWEPQDHWEVKASIRSGPMAGWILYSGEILSHEIILDLMVPWRKWGLTLSDANHQLPMRKVGAFDGKTWVDTSGLGIFVNIDENGHSLKNDKLTVQHLFDKYFRYHGRAMNTVTYVNKYIPADDFYPIEWSYSDLQAALNEMAALIQANLQFWIDPDDNFHWQTIPAWQDMLQDMVALSADPTSSTSAMMMPEAAAGVGDLTVAPYAVVDVNSDPDTDTIGFRNLSFQFDGSDMPEQTYVKGSTGYVYNAPAPTDDVEKVIVEEPTPGVEATYRLTFLTSTKIWHTDDTGFVSTSFDFGNGGPYRVKWVSVAWSAARHKGGNYWKLLEGPDQGKLVDDHTNDLAGYGEIRVKRITDAAPATPKVGVGGSGWVDEETQDPNKRQSYLEAPISTNKKKRDRIGGTVLKRAESPTLRGSVEVYGLDGWRVGQAVRVTDARLPAVLNNRYYVIQRVKTTLIEGNDLRRYTLDLGDGPRSRWSMQLKPGDITWPPPFSYIEVKAYDLSPGPDSTQRITAQLVAPDGTPWRVKGKTINWSFKVFDNLGTEYTDQGEIKPEVSPTDRFGRAYTKLTTGPMTGLVYYVFADVKAD